MERLKTNIIQYVLLAIASVLAIYFFYKYQSTSSEFESFKIESKKAAQNETLASISSIDSLLFEGRYDEALRAYQRLNENSGSSAAEVLSPRMKFLRQLIKARDSKATFVDTTKVSKSDSNEVRRATPLEIRQFDSLNFALSKAQLQIENLKNQLQQTSKGSYLTFTSSKGREMYYVGEVRNNKANGKGVALLKSGSRYEGDWVDNQRHGKGKFFWPDGEVYDGEYLNDKRHGLGTYLWPNGEKYYGQWANDQRSGKGVFYGKEGDIIAKGIWKNDELVEVDKE